MYRKSDPVNTNTSSFHFTSDDQTNKAESMQTDEEKKEAVPEKKISTSGPRNNRREQWRKARGWTAKKTGTQKGVKGKRRR